MSEGRPHTASPGRRWTVGAAHRGVQRAETWKELTFHAAHFPIAVAGFGWVVVATTLGGLLAVTVIGLPVSAALFSSTRWVALPTSALTENLLGRPVALAPQTAERSAAAVFRDPASWRAYAYAGVGFALTTVTLTVSGAMLVIAAAASTFPLWRSTVTGLDGAAFTSTGVALATCAAGLVVLVAVWPAVNHGLACAQVFVIRALLAPTPTEQRLAELAASRAATLEDADTTLRRIERDLHDGAQARLVSLAMILGDALERVRRGAEPASIELQLTSAVEVTTETLTELRALVRGIHPPVLDSGLDAALRSAVGRAGVPVHLHLDVPERRSPVVESIVYFAVLELLTNVHKHADATTVFVDVQSGPDGLVADVRDDGRGGAVVDSGSSDGRGTGLAGVRARVRAVDGVFTIESPIGGPTTARLTIPGARQR